MVVEVRRRGRVDIVLKKNSVPRIRSSFKQQQQQQQQQAHKLQLYKLLEYYGIKKLHLEDLHFLLAKITNEIIGKFPC